MSTFFASAEGFGHGSLGAHGSHAHTHTSIGVTKIGHVFCHRSATVVMMLLLLVVVVVLMVVVAVVVRG